MVSVNNKQQNTEMHGAAAFKDELERSLNLSPHFANMFPRDGKHYMGIIERVSDI